MSKAMDPSILIINPAVLTKSGPALKKYRVELSGPAGSMDLGTGFKPKINFTGEEPYEAVSSIDYTPVGKTELSLSKMKGIVKSFTEQISDALETIELPGKNFTVDTIEISAVLSADGKLGILGSSIGTKAEGSIKFVFKKKP